MEHDGKQDGNSCDSDNYVMSPTLGSGKTGWSSCSRDYLEKFLQTPQASCVLQPSEHDNILTHFRQSDWLPGQLFDADQQCVLRFGPKSRASQSQPPEEKCQLLRCESGPLVVQAHPALPGTRCGDQKWCLRGSCSPIPVVRDHVTSETNENMIRKRHPDIDKQQHRHHHNHQHQWSAARRWTQANIKRVTKEGREKNTTNETREESHSKECNCPLCANRRLIMKRSERRGEMRSLFPYDFRRLQTRTRS